MKYRNSFIAAAATIVLAVAVAIPVSASAEDTTTSITPSAGSDRITVETFDLEGNLLYTESIDSGSAVTLGDNSGSGGTSSASGCRKVTVHNEKETLLGKTAYWFNTWTRWCWNRADRIIYDVTTGFYLSDVDPFYYWRGLIVDNTYHFSWYSGYPKSGYRHEKQGHFENCIVKYGCISSSYPYNLLYSYSNGTFTWHTSD